MNLSEEMRRLSEKATAGPWSSDEHGGSFYVYGEGDEMAMVADNETEDGFVPPEVVARMRGTGRGATDEEKQTNASLIVFLRNHVPDLLAALDRLERCEAMLAEHGLSVGEYTPKAAQS